MAQKVKHGSRFVTNSPAVFEALQAKYPEWSEEQIRDAMNAGMGVVVDRPFKDEDAPPLSHDGPFDPWEGPAEKLFARFDALVARDVSLDPPAPLVIDRLDPESQTMLYGPGEVGKGIVAASWAAELTKRGDRVMVSDFEGHRPAWVRKFAAFGGSLDRLLVVEPYGSGWTGAAGPIWAKASDLAMLAIRFEARWHFVDSIAAACLADISTGNTEPANRYGAAVQTIGLPTLSLAHVGRTSDLRYPFGSVFWHNWARVTWSLIEEGASGRKGTEEDDVGGDGDRILQNRKYSDGPRLPPQKADWKWVHTSIPPELDWQPYEPAVWLRVADALWRFRGEGQDVVGPRELAHALSLDGGKPITRQAVSKAAAAHPEAFRTVAGEGVSLAWLPKSRVEARAVAEAVAGGTSREDTSERLPEKLKAVADGE